METGTQPAPAPAPAAAPPPAATVKPTSRFAEAFNRAAAKHSGSPAPSQGSPQEPAAPSAPSAPQAPAQSGDAQPPKPRAPAGVPTAAYHAERSKRQELQAQLAVEAQRRQALEAELAKLRQSPAPAAAQPSAEDAWLAQLADDDPATKIAKEFAEYRKQNDDRWQQVEARNQVMLQEQQDTALSGLLDTLHDRLPNLDAAMVDQFAISLIMAEPENGTRELNEILLPLWELNKKLTPPAAPRAQSAPGAPAPKPPPQIGAPTTPQGPPQHMRKPGDLARYVSDRLRQQQQ